MAATIASVAASSFVPRSGGSRASVQASQSPLAAMTVARRSCRRRITADANAGLTSTKADPRAKTALTTSPTGMATWKPAYPSEKRISGVPSACSPRKAPVAMNASERRKTRASWRRFAASPAA